MQCLHLGGHCKTLLKYSNMFSQSLHLGGHPKLGNDLSIGVNSSTKAWPEKICFQIRVFQFNQNANQVVGIDNCAAKATTIP